MKTAKEVREYVKKRKRKKGKKRPWISFPKGEYLIRICPPWKKKGEVWKDVLFHGGWKNKVYCAKNDIDEETGKQRKCIICRRLVELKTDRSKRGKKLWSLINQRSEGLWNVLVARKTKKRNGARIVLRYKDNQCKLWRASYKWHMALVDIFSDDDYREKSLLGVTHPKYGRLIKLVREGSGRDDTSYVFRVLDKTTPIFKDEEKTEAILQTKVNLDKVVSGSSDEELKAFLRKMEKKAKVLARRDEEDDENDEDSDDVDEDDDDGGKKKKKKKSSEDDDDDDENEDDSDSDDDDDEDEDDDDGDDDLDRQYKKMKKGLKKKKHRKEEDDDDEDEEEDED